jgi:antitoxin (DNA-binding transcriptional repressor) of toxin-antitoxin stability system
MDLRRSLGSILDAASAGERFVVERDHRPLAMIVSVEEGRRLEGTEEERRARVLAALDRLDAFQERMARKYPRRPGDLDAVDAIRADRARDDPPPDERG